MDGAGTVLKVLKDLKRKGISIDKDKKCIVIIGVGLNNTYGVRLVGLASLLWPDHYTINPSKKSGNTVGFITIGQCSILSRQTVYPYLYQSSFNI